jgi:hypothetical protein
MRVCSARGQLCGKREEVWIGTLVTDGNADSASAAGIVDATMESFPSRQAAP